MRVPAVFMALSAFALSAVPVDAQLLKARGDQAQLRRGPGAEHAPHSVLAGRDTVLQLGREGEWIATHRGWVEADSVEWTVPLEERGEPAVSVSPVVSIDSRVNKHAVSPNGSLIALSKLGGEREVLVFKTQDQQFVTRLDVADFGGYSDIAFLDENTLLLLKGDRTSGISEPEIPSDELVIDIPSGKTLFRGRGLFGYLGRNPHDREGHILSFTADLVRLHDPQSFETLAAIGTCSGDDVPCKEVESTFLDVSYDKAKDEISAIVNVEASARDNDSGFINPYYYYLIVRASSLSELADKISSLSGTRLDTDLETHFFTQIPAQDLFLTWKFGDAVGEPGATLVEAFDIQTKRLSGDFLFFGTEADIVICKDEQDIFGWTSGVPATGETIETVELTSIRLESDRSLVRNPAGMSLARNWSNGATVCLDPGRRASVREQAHIFSIDEGSTPEISQVDVQYNPYTFALRYEGEIIRWGVEFAESPIIDLDRLEEQAAPIEEFEDAESVRGYSFANPAGERVVTRTNDLGPIRIVNKDGRERIISDTEARNIFAGYVRSYDGSAMLVMSGQRKLSILNTVTGDLVEIREMANLDAYNEQYGTDRYLKEGWMGSSSSEGSTFAFSADGKLLHVLEQDASKIEVIDTSTGMKLREYPAELGWCGTAAATMPPNGRFACQDSDGINILNFQTGTIITRVPVSSFLQLSQLALDEQGRLLFQVTGEGILIHSIASGREIARLYMQRGSSSEQNGEATEPRWLLITTEGFYAGNTRSDELLQAAFGVDQVYAIDKFRDALYRPDLVAEALKGDPERLAAAAASEISLEKILHSGAAPEIRIRGDLAGD
ncbi:hypothetical protein L598_000700000010, partial [Mesorhizobium sp. J18]|uniref:YncE family protein n=1 Tax=Mesorhizobium sp. J18 TaxID=935263 RepID=UPI00119B7313